MISRTCAGTTQHFQIQGEGEYASYFWEFGDGYTSKEAVASHHYQHEGNYEVKLTVSDSKGREASSFGQLIVLPTSDATFSWSDNYLLNQHDPAISFRAQSNDASLQWSFGDRLTSQEANPRHLYRQKGAYQVRLISNNQFGCADTNVQQIQVASGYNLYAPTGFTPNGDQLNDHWIPRALENGNIPFVLNIYEQKTGHVVYTTSNADQPWDGSILGSQRRANIGETFLWTALVTEEDGTQREYSGTITVAGR